MLLSEFQKNLCLLNKQLCSIAAQIHQSGFDFPWDSNSFESLLLLPTTIGWVHPSGLLVCSRVCDEMEILTICIEPQYRQKGMATAFLKHLFQYAEQHQIKRIFLEVSIENKNAYHLYLKQGFVQTGYRKNYYKTKTGYCDAICMEKIITSK